MSRLRTYHGSGEGAQKAITFAAKKQELATASKCHVVVLVNYSAAEVFGLLVAQGAVADDTAMEDMEIFGILQAGPSGGRDSVDFGASGRPTPNGFSVVCVDTLSGLGDLDTNGVDLSATEFSLCDVSYS